MAPASGRMIKERSDRIRRILPLLVRHHSLIGLGISSCFSLNRSSHAIGVTKSASFQFFCDRVEYLLRHDEIQHLVGVPTLVFNELLGNCRHNESCSFPKVVRLAVFLKFCREGNTQSGLSREIGLSQPTISRILRGVIDDLVRCAPQYIKFPKTRSEIFTMQQGFYEKRDGYGNERRMPCFGVLDGKHWQCQHPPDSGSLNYNYKGYYSYNSLFICDSEFRIFYIQISELGINSDSQLYSSGPLKTLLETAAATGGFRQLPDSDIVMPPFVLADNGFALSKVVMQPFRATELTRENLIFNDQISGTRVKIENLFGILTSKFQIFQRALKLDPPTSRSLIVALSVVHNMTVGPLALLTDTDERPIIIDPYKNPKLQRLALKKFLLKH